MTREWIALWLLLELLLVVVALLGFVVLDLRRRVLKLEAEGSAR